MAEAAQDWTKILRELGPAEAHAPEFSGAKRAANDRAGGAAATPEEADAAVEADLWAETLARVHGAADLLRTRENQLRELERVHRAALDRAAERISALEQQLAAETQRATRSERAQADAEEWLRRIHTAVVEQFPA